MVRHEAPSGSERERCHILGENPIWVLFSVFLNNRSLIMFRQPFEFTRFLVNPKTDRPVFPPCFFCTPPVCRIRTFVHIMFHTPGVKPKISPGANPGANPASIPARPPGRGHGPGDTGLHPRRRRPTFRAAVRAPFVFRPRPGPPQTGGAPAAGESGAGRLRRGAGVVERGGLENRCALCVPWVRIPPSPPTSCPVPS